jgi:hypothetical protein
VQHYAFVRGVPNLVKTAYTPRHTPRTRTRHSHLPKPIESDVEQDHAFGLALKFQKCIKFRVHFPKQVSVLHCHRMGLDDVCTNGFNASLVQHNADVLFWTGNVQAHGVRNAKQTLNLFCVHNKNGLRDVSPVSRK